MFTFCGFNGKYLNSIEQLDVQSLLAGNAQEWELISINTSSFTPRYCVAVTAISPTEIMVLGGLFEGNY